MDDVLEQDHSMTNDDFKGSSTRSSKPSSNASRSRQDKRRRRRTNSEHSSSSSRSSSSSSSTHSTQSSNVEPQQQQQDSTTSTTKKCRSALAQEHLQTIIEKTKTGHYDIIDNFAFLTFETDDDWRRALEHFHQHEQYQKNFSTKKSLSTSTKKNEHSDGLNSTLHRSISAPCKSEDGQRIHSTPNSVPADETMTDNHRSSLWQKNSHDLSSTKTIKTETMDTTARSHRNKSEHDDSQTNHREQSPPSSSHKSNDENKNETQEKKNHHHHNHHHHHKSHKKHKSKHDVTVNCDSSTKHPTITSMSDLAKQHIKSESMPMGHSFPFPSHFDPKLFPLPPYPPFPSPSTSHSHPYDSSLMLAGRLYGGQYPRDLPMPPPPPPLGAHVAHPSSRSLPTVDSAQSMEKLFEKFYPGVLPSYLTSAPVSSMNMKLPGTTSNGSEHSLWPHRDAYQRQFHTNSTTKSNSTKIPPHHQPSPSPTDRPHHSSNPNPPTQTPLYIAPVIVTEFHQHQHNHNHTHEHKLNITTKDERSQSNSSASPRSKSPLSTENKKAKSSFSVNDMFIDKPSMKPSPSPHQQGFLSVMNKKETHNNNNSTNNSHLPLKKTFNGKWSTAHIHIARMISQHERNQREKIHSNNKLRSTPAPPPLLPPPLPLLENHNDLSLIRPPLPSPFGLPLDMNLSPYPLFRPPPTSSSSSSSSSAMKLSRPNTTTPSAIKPPSIKRELKTPFLDDRLHRPSPPPPLPSPALSRSTSGSNFPPSSPSQRLRMDFPSLLLPPHQHQLPNFSLPDDRKRFLPTNADLLPPSFQNPSAASQFLFSMGTTSLPGMPPSPSSRRNVHLGNSDPSKTSLFPPPPPSSSSGPSSLNPFDFARPHLLPGGMSLPNPSFESDRYRFILEQQARERELQFAFMAASASNGNGPGAPGLPPPPHPSLFPDPNTSAMFKHY